MGLTLAVCSPATFAKPTPVPVTDKAASSVTMGDRSWVKKMATGGAEEVLLGQLAAKKALSPEVKAFAEQMVSDHSKANQELKTLADKKGIQLDKATAPSANYKMLNGLSGAQFDKEYVSMMVADHKEDVAAFDKEAKKGGDPNLTSWAGKTLPTLQAHLSKIQAIQLKTGGK